MHCSFSDCSVENEDNADNGDVQLTMEMVQAEFASMEADCLQDDSATQSVTFQHETSHWF